MPASFFALSDLSLAFAAVDSPSVSVSIALTSAADFVIVSIFRFLKSWI